MIFAISLALAFSSFFRLLLHSTMPAKGNYMGPLVTRNCLYGLLGRRASGFRSDISKRLRSLELFVHHGREGGIIGKRFPD